MMIAHNDQLKKQFDLRAPTFEKSAHWVTDESLVSAHVKMAGVPVGKALELCCGTGAVSRGLKAAGWDVTGVDISPGMVQEAAKYIKAQVGDVTKLAFAAQTFDMIAMRQAYFLLDDGVAALREVRRLLKPGGKFILSHLVPFSEIDSEYLRAVHTKKQAQMRKFHTVETLSDELEGAGFRVTGQDNVTVRESVSLWMEQAPELSSEIRQAVCDLVTSAPAAYKNLRNVKVEEGEIREDWNFVLLEGRP